MNRNTQSAVSAIVTPGNVPGLRKLLVKLTLMRARTSTEAHEGIDTSTSEDDLDIPSALEGVGLFVRLSEIAKVTKGPTGIKDARPGPYPLVVTAEDRGTCDHYDLEGEAVLIPTVSSTGHGDASLKRIHYQEGRFAVGSILAAVQVRDRALHSARFLYEYLSVFKDELLVARMSGTANVSLTVKKIEGVPIPLVPFAQQQQLHDLMHLCDALEAKGRLEAEQHTRLLDTLLGTLTDSATSEELAANWQRVAEHFDLLLDRPEAVDALEQTILQLAVRGLLVPQDPNDDPAGALLQRVRAEKERLIAEGKIKRDKLVPSISDSDDSIDLPQGWSLTYVGDLVDMLNGYAFKSEWFKPAGTRLLRNVNIAHGHVDWNTPAYIDGALAKEYVQFALDEGDLVLTLDRPIISTGLKFAVIGEQDLPCLLLQRVARLSPDPRVLLRDFFVLWMLSDAFIGALDPGRSNGVPHISTKQVASMPFRLPPIAEQTRIVARVTELRRLCADLRQRLAASQTTQSRLAAALVEAATP
jgi:type I restriction enzyme S subunit